MASSIESLYKEYETIYLKLKSYQDEYDKASKHLEDFKVEDEAVRQARIANFDKQLKDIGVYYARIEYFRQLAEKNITTKNVVSLKPVPLDFNSLRYDAARIDTQNPNDEYAYRLYVKTRCNEIYLMQKRNEFEEKREELLSGYNVKYEEMKASVEKAHDNIIGECIRYVQSNTFVEFASKVRRIHSIYDTELYDEHTLVDSDEYKIKDTMISLGMRAQPLPVVGDKAISIVKGLFTEIYTKVCYFDDNSQNVLLPVDYDIAKEVCVYVRCSAVKANRCFKGVNNFILNRLRRTKPGDRNFIVNFIDALHYNNSELKALKPLEGTSVLEKVPQSTEMIEETLCKIIAEFTDIDDKLQDYETVCEYNLNNSENKICNRLIVLNGYPRAFSESARKCVDRIIYNHQRYGISIILVENMGYDKMKDEDKDERGGSTANVYYIDMPVGKTSTIRCDNEVKVGFRWYEYDYKNKKIPAKFIEEVKREVTTKEKISIEYTKNFALQDWQYNQKGNKNIVLPYGVDGKGEIRYIAFDNENFAAYLMGASGSGKSTLLHVLITGILRNYHPDDVELWLADFKMAEFSQYINPMPPHVKYILLDESDELVYDLIDKLTNIMYERQNYYMELKKKAAKDNPAAKPYMPVIFVILDEFSIMSQVLARGDEAYKLKLQNILAKGRSLGIKMIFSSQSFLNGIQGLTPTAKEQIQSRIAMRNTTDEIETTLELPSFMKTEENKYWIATLPTHKALRKYREKSPDDEDETILTLERTSVMYFPGKDDAYLPQREMIDDINSRIKKSETYNPDDTGLYRDKHPVVVDGNTYDSFNPLSISCRIDRYKEEQKDNLNGDELLVYPGRPRLMDNMRELIITPESRQNILIIANASEQRCAASIITSCMKSYQLQGKKVSIWAYERNMMYKKYSDSEWLGYDKVSRLDYICDKIREYKEMIDTRQFDIGHNELIVLLGFESLCIEFEYIKNTNMIKSDYVTASAEEQGIPEEISNSLTTFDDDNSDLSFLGDMDDDDIEFNGSGSLNGNSSNISTITSITSMKEVDESKIYNAKADLQAIVKMGSRLGVHFLMCVNSIADIKQTGIGEREFVHRMAFRMPKDDVSYIFPSGSASSVSGMPQHVCMYTDTMSKYSFRPYIHKYINWDGWQIDSNGNVVNYSDFNQ